MYSFKRVNKDTFIASLIRPFALSLSKGERMTRRRPAMFMFAILFLVLAGCGSDLSPSSSDKRPLVDCGTLGTRVCQQAPDFTLSDSLGNTVTLSSLLSSPTLSGVVIYFTMWCPTCTADMSLTRDSIMPAYPHVAYVAVDYVSASVAQARDAEVSNGFDGSGFIVLADINRTVYGLENATMATTIVIDKNGIVRMNETFKIDKLQNTLAALPQ